jgi:hypothetical protein
MSSKVKHIRIEKYDIEAFKKEQKPYAQILNEVIQRCPINHANEFLLWCFLESLPATWTPNKHHIMEYFNISERSYERYLGWLNAVGLIEYRQERNKDGSFGKWELIVLNGTKFNPDAASNRSAKIGGAVIHRLKKAEVIHIPESTVSAKIGGTAEASTDHASTGLSEKSPFRQKTTERSNGGHINTTYKNRKERMKTNNPTVSVFSDTQIVKDYIERVVANRKVQEPLDDDIIDQGIYYSYETNKDKSFDSVNKRINIFLKKVREGKWLIPQGYNGITSQSIREKEELKSKEKQEQYRQEAKVYQAITETIVKGEGLKNFSEMFKKLKAEVNG